MHIVLFHSALGLRPGVKQFAKQLQAAGHTVMTPDLYDGETLDDYQPGNKKWFAIGVPAILQKAQAACKDVPDEVLFAGFSNGAAVAEYLGATHPGSRGVVLMHGVMPLAMLQLKDWPRAVPVQLHYNKNDPFRDPKNETTFEAAVAASGASFEEFLYEGDTHLFADPDLPDYKPESADLMLKRVLEFAKGH